MRRTLLISAALFALVVTSATAGEGINLRWSNCLTDAGASNRSFACNTNLGSNVLVGSFELSSAVSNVSGQEITMDVQTDGAGALPAWWGFKNAGTCRMTSLSINFVLPATAVNCLDWSDGQSAGGIAAYNIGFTSVNRARLLAVSAVPQSALANLNAGQEYFIFNLVINNQKTVGTGACVGCGTSANVVFGKLKVTTPVASNDFTLTNPSNGFDSNLATWQGGFPTATRRQTWGAVKALYR